MFLLNQGLPEHAALFMQAVNRPLRFLLRMTATGFSRPMGATSHKRLLSALSLCCFYALGGCVSGSVAQPGAAVVQPSVALGQAGYTLSVDRNYVLRPSDKISVVVFREKDLSVESVPISAEGRISLPLVGGIDAAGMTIAEVESSIEQILGARYLRNPDVSVNIVEYVSHRVTVEGAVENPGLFTFLPGTRLSGGISMAQGLTRVSDIREVAVFRQTGQGMQVAKFDYAAVRSGAMLDPVLYPGDRIVVGTDTMSQLWQDVLKALPALGIFTRI